MSDSKRKQLVQYGKQPRKRRLLPASLSSPDMGWFPSLDKTDKSQTPRPTSQKAATMPAEPDEENVTSLMEVTGMGKKEAVRYLKAKGNDVSSAVLAFFDGEDISKAENASQWDETLFSAGKDGDFGNGNLRPLGSAAATRPNSPAPSIGGRSNLQPSSKQQEDDDLAAAMAMSQGDLGAPFQQETGRIGASGQQTFGPATRETYEADKWAVVPTSVHNTNEIVPDADLEQRVHTPGEPRLLKYLPTGDYTPNLLTICHAINGTREAMLMRDHVQISYGQDGEWWKGHPISLPKIINVDDGSSAQPESDKDDELLAEVQRIMAFLSTSNRSYASCGGLTHAETIKNADRNVVPSRTLLEHFLKQWSKAASTKSGTSGDMSALFNNVIGTHGQDGINATDMTLIDMPVNIQQDSKSDLFEQLDDLLWDTKGTDTVMSDNHIERPAQVLVMRAYQQNATLNPQLRLEIPAELYVDKYLPANIETTQATRGQMAEGRKRISKIEEIERKLKTWKHPKKNEQLDSRSLLKHTLGHFSGQNRLEALNADKAYTNHTNLNTDDMSVDQPHYQDIAKKLEKVIASIDDKLLMLEEEKEKTRKTIAEMSKAPPAGLNNEDLRHRYSLRGVATKPNITYVLVPEDPSSNAADGMVDDDSTPQGWRWWRMEYEVSGASGARITRTKSADYDVLRAVELEHSSALLIYASDRIVNAPSLIADGETLLLPAPLREFVERDNQLFAAELESERNKPPAYDFNDEIYNSRNNNERTSLDSTRVEGGGSDLGGEPSPPGYPEFADDEFFGQGEGSIKQGYRLNEVGHVGVEDDDVPVHEIKLDTPPETEEMEDEGVEMVEKPGSGMLSQAGPKGEDATMEDVRKTG